MRYVALPTTILLAGAVALLMARGTPADGADGKPELPRMKRVTAIFNKTAGKLTLRAVFAQPLRRARLRRTQLLLDIGTRTGEPQQLPGGETSRVCEGGLHAQLKLGRGKARVYRVDDNYESGRTVALRFSRNRRSVWVKLRWPFQERPVCLGGALNYFEGWDVGDHDDHWFLETGVFNRKGIAVAKPVPEPDIAVAVPD